MTRRSPASRFLARLDAALEENRVFISHYARETAWSELTLHEDDIFAMLYELAEEDFDHAVPSTAEEGGDIWVFLPITTDGRVWIRLCERDLVVVVSFHRG